MTTERRRRSIVSAIALAAVGILLVWVAFPSATTICPAVLPVPFACQPTSRLVVAVSATAVVAAITATAGVAAARSKVPSNWTVRVAMIASAAVAAAAALVLFASRTL